VRHEPVEDYRIDFEDGFGIRSDADEDARWMPRRLKLRKGTETARCRRSLESA